MLRTNVYASNRLWREVAGDTVYEHDFLDFIFLSGLTYAVQTLGLI